MPRLGQGSGSTTRRQFVDSCDRCGLIAEQIEVRIRTDLQITEVSAGLLQQLVRLPDCERHKPILALFDRPPGASRKGTAATQTTRLRTWRTELDQYCRFLLFRDKKV